MATILESIAVPRSSSALPRPSVSPISVHSASSSFSSVSACYRRSAMVSEVKLLRVRFSSSARSFGSVSRGASSGSRLGRAGRVVCEAQKTAVEVPAVVDGTWKSLVLECELPVLVEFWAPWCGPCRMIHPIIDKLAKQYAGKLKCYKVNTDESPTIASQYGIRSIPTVIFFKNGEKKEAVIGAVPELTLTNSIEKFL